MTEPFILKDGKQRAAYVVYGDYKHMIPLCSFKTGSHSAYDRFVLRLQSWRRYWHARPTERMKTLILRLEAALGNTVTGFILYDTSWYKETQWIGFVETKQGIFFVKLFATAEELMFQTHQAGFMREHFFGPFVILPVVHQYQTVISYPAIMRKRDITIHDGVLEKILHHTQEMLSTKSIEKQPDEILPFQFFSLLHEYGSKDMIERIKAKIGQNTVPFIPIHGDFVSWNLFVNTEEKLVLTDYERAGWHVPYYDAFHFILQPQALEKSTLSVRKIMSRYHWFDPALENLLMFYLIDQLNHDLSGYLHNNIVHKHTRPVIDTKFGWLKELIDG